MNQSLKTTLSKYTTIVLVGGGTGGHIQPIVSLVNSFRKEAVKWDEAKDFVSEKIPPTPLVKGESIHKFLWIGGKDSQEEKIAKEKGIKFLSIPTLKLATTKSFKVLLYPFFLNLGFWKARRILSSVIATKEAIQKPRSPHSTLFRSRGQEQICVFSKGGPGSVAIGIAAWTLGIPLYIHESDTIPGRSNRILARIATGVFLGFESARKYFNKENSKYIGQILSPVFEKGEIRNKKGTINWKTTKKHILVICGSQGSQVIFEEIIQSFSGDDTYEWIIALGKLNSNMQDKFRKIPDCQAVEWISQEDIAHILSDTNIAISRGSATTLAEIDVFGVRKIIIPLPYSAENHQYWNAKEYEERGDILLEQKNLHKLTEIITTNVGYSK